MTRDSSTHRVLQLLEYDCRDCRRCAHGSTRKQAVFSRGDAMSTIAFVGEAPGADEDERGEPFIGESGKLVDKQIAAMRDHAAQLGVAFPTAPYICNVVKCRPPSNKLLADGSDVKACSDAWLWPQLHALPNLRVVVALGCVAAQTLLSSKETIGNLRGRKFQYIEGGGKVDEARLPFWSFDVISTYHPSYLLRQPNRRDIHNGVWADLKLAVDALR